MSAKLRQLLIWSMLGIGLAAGLLVIGQVLQLADLAYRVHPTFGQAVFWGLVFALGAVFAVPLISLWRLPAALIPPESDTGPEFDRHVVRVRQRLAANPLLEGQAIQTQEAMEAALSRLDELATKRIRATAQRAFLTTAVSQNGSLDALIVLGLQARLVWDVASIYTQRPPLRQMAYLYSNVLLTAYLSGELDEADAAKGMEPAISAVLGSAAGIVPGLQVATNIFVNSVLSGTANAFLTLRVGIIARESCRAVTRPPRSALRRTAVAQAAALLGAIVLDGAADVSAAIARGAGRGVKGAVTGTGKAVAGAITGTGRRITSAGASMRDRFWKDDDDEGHEPEG